MKCDQCGTVVYRQRFVRGAFRGEECGCAGKAPVKRAGNSNKFGDLTLDHVTGEDGKKVRVSSLRQLREAEKRFNFASVVGNMDHGNVDIPPQQRTLTVADVVRRKFMERR